MKKLMGAAMLAGATVAGVGAANAETSASVAMTTDYVWRGLSQSDGDFAVQGSFDFTHETFYAGAWASSVDFGTGGSNAELDLYAGVTPSVGPVSLDFGIIGYFYPGSTDGGGDLDFYEVSGTASFNPVEALTIGGVVYWTDDFGTFDQSAAYGEVNASYAFSEAFSATASYGNQDVDSIGSYNSFKVGGALAMHGFGFDLSYTSTDGADGFTTGSNGDERFSFTVSRSL